MTTSGDWPIIEYDEKGNEIYYEDSDGYWEKREYDEKGNQVYYEDRGGYWEKIKYDENDNVIYHKDSNGYDIDKQAKELTSEEIEKLLVYKFKMSRQ